MALEEHLEVVVDSQGFDGAIAKARELEESLKATRDAAMEMDGVGGRVGSGLDGAIARARAFEEELKGARDAAAELDAIGGGDFAGLTGARAAASGLRDDLAEAAAAADGLAAAMAGVDAELGDADLEQAADDAEQAAGSFGALGSVLTPMAAGLGALVVGAVASASAIAAAGLGVGSFAALAVPSIEKVKTAYTNLHGAQAAYRAAVQLEDRDPTTSNLAAQAKALAQLQTARAAFAKLPSDEQAAVRGVESFEAAWSKLGRTSGVRQAAFGDIASALRVAKNLLPDVGTLAKAAEKPISGLLGDLNRDVKSSGFKNFIKDMAKEEGPAIRSLSKLGGALTTFAGKDILQKLAPISPGFINSISHMVKAFGPGTGSLFKNAGIGLTDIDNGAAKAAPEVQAISRALGHIATVKLGNLSAIGRGIGDLVGPLAPVASLFKQMATGSSTFMRIMHDVSNVSRFMNPEIPGLGENPLEATIDAARNHYASGGGKLTMPVDAKLNTSGITNSLAALGKGGKAAETNVKVKMDVSAATAAVGKLRTQLTANLPSPKIKVSVSGIGTVTSAFASVVTAAQGLTGKVSSAVSGLPGVMQGIGAKAGAGLAQGLDGEVGAVATAAQDLAAAAEAAGNVRLQISSPSKVFAKMGKNAVAGLVIGLEGGKSAVAAAMALITGHKAFTDSSITDTIKKLRADVAKAFKDHQIDKAQDTQLTGWIRADNKRLMGLAKQRADIEKQIRAAEAMAKSVASSARQGGSIATIQGTMPAGSVSAAGLEQGMTTQLAAIKKFRTEIAQLKHEGASKAVIRQIAREGVAQGGAAVQALLAGGKGAIQKISQLQHQIAQAAKGLGKTAANASYESGGQIGKGVAAGLKSELSGVEAAIKAMAKKLVDVFKKEMKIHSPSGVMIPYGAAIPAGVGVGIDQGASSATSAMKRLGKTTVAAFHPDPVHAAASNGGSSHGTTPIIVSLNHTTTLDGRVISRSTQSHSLEHARRNNGTGLKLPNRLS